jgi:hypothetical protein
MVSYRRAMIVATANASMLCPDSRGKSECRAGNATVSPARSSLSTRIGFLARRQRLSDSTSDIQQLTLHLAVRNGLTRLGAQDLLKTLWFRPHPAPQMWLARPQDEGQNRFKAIMKRKLRPLTRRSRKELFSLLTTTLPIGQYRVAKALIADTSARTYSAVAAELGVHLGTVHQHMRRIRLQRPKVYAAIMKERGRQLAARHRRALARAKAHTQAWYEIASRLGIYPFGR